MKPEGDRISHTSNDLDGFIHLITHPLGGRISIRPCLRTTGVPACLFVAMLLTASSAIAFDPPRVIGELRGEPDSSAFGNQFCWVGDQNDDGFDDLAVSHRGLLKIYFGGEQVNNTPDVVLDSLSANEPLDPSRVEYLGRFSDDNAHWIAVGGVERDGRRILERRILYYKGGDELDTIPDRILSFPANIFPVIGYDAANRHLSDFNGDGYSDLLVAVFEEVDESPTEIKIHFGSAEFDTAFGWTTRIDYLRWSALSTEFITGGDLNNDGYDDFILNYAGYWIFLGGEPMDTVAACSTNFEAFAPRALRNLAMLGDVNGDGYDDWGCYWHETRGPNEFDGYYLFYGSAEPDFEPDLELQGNSSPFGSHGRMAGGNFNGDGFSDIITINPLGNHEEGELHVYFGAEQIISEPSLAIFPRDEYGYRIGDKIGAVGDYNNDGLDDILLSTAHNNWEFRKLLCLSPSETWRVFVEKEDDITPENWRIELYPNPFNGTLNIKMTIDSKSKFALSVNNLAGRSIWMSNLKVNRSGIETVEIPMVSLPSGVYIICCTNLISHKTVMKKAVLLR